MGTDLQKTDSVADEKLYAETREINAASAALEAAVVQQKPRLLSPNMLRLYIIMGIGYLVSTMNGFDSSLMGAINAMKPYQETFGLDGAGSATGIVFIIYQLGQVSQLLLLLELWLMYPRSRAFRVSRSTTYQWHFHTDLIRPCSLRFDC